jgi:hypothetical protein
MTLQRLRAMLEERPFQPFRIHTSDGEVVPVKSPEYAWVHPSGRVLFVATDPKLDAEQVIDLLHITKLSTVPGRGANGKGRGSRAD